MAGKNSISGAAPVDLAARARNMPNLLPPRAGGALAAITACPAADVIFVAHAGLDQLVSVADVWRSLPMDQVMDEVFHTIESHSAASAGGM